MAVWEIASFAKDLSEFIKLIVNYDIPIETKGLYALESKFQYQDVHYIYIDDLIFNIHTKISGTIPSNINAIAITLVHICELDSAKNNLIEDPIKGNYKFLIKINGYNDAKHEFQNFWRLDQNIASEGTTKYTHPYYHFQSGGDEITAVDSGRIIFLGGPRLPHPPMDLFLGIHFILNNFFSIKDYPGLESLFDNYDYQEIIKRSQQRLWEPYFDCFSGADKHSNFTFKNVFPLFIR